MLQKDFIPTKPFPDFKWKWASLQCTERLNDPVVLLGVLFRMRKLELLNRDLKYSSQEFAQEMLDLSNDLSDSIKVNLGGRVGERNIIRNSSPLRSQSVSMGSRLSSPAIRYSRQRLKP